MAQVYQGNLKKLAHHIDEQSLVQYVFRTNKESLPLNEALGKKLELNFLGEINCVACGRKTNKSFNQGYCYPCLQNLAECDICIVKPELCHFDNGTCRSSEFAAQHCNIDHSLYLSLTSSVKIGVTRSHQETSRWVDQGAVKAMRLLKVKRRYHAGLLEVELAKNLADKTNWRKMLKNEFDDVDLQEQRELALATVSDLLDQDCFGDELDYLSPQDLGASAEELEIKYPVLEYPSKVASLNLDKDPKLAGTLLGIKGQYLILDTGVINIRKFSGYKIEIKVDI